MSKLIKLLPASGFAIAAALVSITSAFKDAPKTRTGQTLYRFKYVPPGSDPYSVANVEKVSNWTYDGVGITCPNGTAKACTIMASQVDDSGDEPVLLDSEDITAALSSSGTAAVTSTVDNDISNRSN